MSAIRLVKRKEIDEVLWNECILQSSHSLPYALSWYLDSVAENWDALVLENYRAVMPLVWLRKLGVRVLYQPYYCQQLGVFGKPVSAQVMALFLKEASSRFPYIHINLHAQTALETESLKLKKRKNLLLDLNRDYTTIRKGYSQNHRRNITKAEKTGLRFSTSESLRNFQSFYLENVRHTGEKFEPQHKKIFLRLTEEILAHRYGQIYAMLLDNKLVAASLVLFHPHRFINVINTSNTAGKETGASHGLFDKIIQIHANTPAVFDFEGSSIPAIARFYQGFGPVEETFYLYQTNLLKSLSQRIR